MSQNETGDILEGFLAPSCGEWYQKYGYRTTFLYIATKKQLATIKPTRQYSGCKEFVPPRYLSSPPWCCPITPSSFPRLVVAVVLILPFDVAQVRRAEELEVLVSIQIVVVVVAMVDVSVKAALDCVGPYTTHAPMKSWHAPLLVTVVVMIALVVVLVLWPKVAADKGWGEPE